MAHRGRHIAPRIRRISRTWVLPLTLAMSLVWSGVAWADDISNNLDTTVDATAEVMNLTAGGASGATLLLVDPQNGDGKNGCNLTGSTTLVVSVSSSNTSVATVSPNSISFGSCGDTPTVTVTPVGAGFSTISLTQTSNSTDGTFNLNPATFTVNVAAPPPPSDTTPPVITPNVSGTLGNNGWYTSNVTVTFAVTDNESMITSKSVACDANNQVTGDTSGVTFTCEATSAGGTASEAVTIKRDATAPTLNPSVSPNPVIRHASATASANASDSLSDLDSSSCDAVDTSTLGSGQTVTCYARDNAGNTSQANATYTVILSVIGFERPVDMNVRNVAKAGQAVPLKFHVSDALGAVTDLTVSDVKVTVATLTCDRGETLDEVEEYATGSSGLQNLGAGFYQFNWSTPKAYASSCKTMTLTAGGGARSAAFEFKK